jgi:hypothetical protein
MNDDDLIARMKLADRSLCDRLQLERPPAIAAASRALRVRRQSRCRAFACGSIAAMCCAIWWLAPSMQNTTPVSENVLAEEKRSVELPDKVETAANSMVPKIALTMMRLEEESRATQSRLREELRALQTLAFEQDQQLAREEASRLISTSELSWKLTF